MVNNNIMRQHESKTEQFFNYYEIFEILRPPCMADREAFSITQQSTAHNELFVSEYLTKGIENSAAALYIEFYYIFVV